MIVLMSGGIDSTVLAAHVLQTRREKVIPLFIDYGQKQFEQELIAFINVCEFYSLKPNIINMRDVANAIREYGTDSRWAIMRNTILLSMACGVAAGLEESEIGYATHVTNYDMFSDCSPMFVDDYNALLATLHRHNKKLSLYAPFTDYTKTDIVRCGIKLNAPIHLTYSCYTGNSKECGECWACTGKLKALKEANYDLGK